MRRRQQTTGVAPAFTLAVPFDRVGPPTHTVEVNEATTSAGVKTLRNRRYAPHEVGSAPGADVGNEGRSGHRE